MESFSIYISVDLPSQISYNQILNPKEGKGLGISDCELQGFGLLFLYKMPSFPKHQSALLEAHVPSRKTSIPTVNLANGSFRWGFTFYFGRRTLHFQKNSTCIQYKMYSIQNVLTFQEHIDFMP